MPANLVQFQCLEAIDAISKQFGDSHVIVAAENPEGLGGLLKNKRLFSTKFRVCAVIERKDNNALQKVIRSAELVAVRGVSAEMCAWAANSKGATLLLQPFNSEKCFLDIQTANVLAQNGVFVAVIFSDFLRASGSRLSQFMKNAAMCVRLCSSAGAKLVFVSGAKEENEMRAAKDLASFAVLLGMNKEEALKSVRSAPLEIREGNA